MSNPGGDIRSCGHLVRATRLAAVNSTPPTSQYGETSVASSSRALPAAGCAGGGWQTRRYLELFRWGCKVEYGAPMPSICVCPICQGRTEHSRSVGDLTVASCSHCGHGWLTDLPQKNRHYDPSHYVNWRHENQAATRRRAK